jgi:hypothetical protein
LLDELQQHSLAPSDLYRSAQRDLSIVAGCIERLREPMFEVLMNFVVSVGSKVVRRIGCGGAFRENGAPNFGLPNA